MNEKHMLNLSTLDCKKNDFDSSCDGDLYPKQMNMEAFSKRSV